MLNTRVHSSHCEACGREFEEFGSGYEVCEILIRQIRPLTSSRGCSFIVCKDCSDKVVRPLLASWYELTMQPDARAESQPQAAVDLNKAPSLTS